MKCEFPNCKAWAIRGDTLCISHSIDPDVIRKRTIAHKKGGYAKKIITEPISIDTITDVKGLLNEVINLLRNTRGQTISRCRTLLMASQVMIACISEYELESRITEIEKRLNDKNL